MNGVIFDIKEFAVHDGPGLRSTVFFKGCPLRCIWCHNPEGLSKEPQLMASENVCLHCGLCRIPCTHPDCRPFGRCLHICPKGLLRLSGETVSSQQLLQRLRRNRLLFTKQGGVTFSGGEPLMQGDFLLEVLSGLSDVHTAIETSGYCAPALFQQVISQVKLIYMDLKLADDKAHRKFTGVSNRPILENLEQLRRSGQPCVIRTPLIPGITDREENLRAIRALCGGLSQEYLPYNQMAGAKYTMLGMPFAYEQYQKEKL